jgi:Ca-activated chloride channel homolog
MSAPSLELIPLRPAVRTDAAVTLDLLVRIVPPTLAGSPKRPLLNLGLVLDHSGSMAGSRKIDYARQAAVYAVQQLLTEDRVSVTIFDDTVKTIAPSAPAKDKPGLVALINRVEPAGSTALHAGWQEGGHQVRSHLVPGGLNRILLLTDGLANVGETNPDTIAGDVKRQAREGVSTTTMGVGNDYNEDLLEAMARSGDGNYYYIESPQQLPDIFQTELHGLMATVGHRVLLGIEPLTGVRVADVINDLDRDTDGRLVLPNLVVGMPIEVVLRLQVPAQRSAADLVGFRLTWQGPEQGEQSQTATLRLAAVDMAGWEALSPDPRVQEQVAVQMAARAKRESSRSLEQGDRAAAEQWLQQARAALCASPQSDLVEQEGRALDEVEAQFREGDDAGFNKKAKWQHYNRSRSKPS